MPTLIKTVPLPTQTAKEPADRLIEFYCQLGWDRSVIVDPSLVQVTKDDYQQLLDTERKHAKIIHPELNNSDITIGINILWCNSGPSGSGKTLGMVELYSGWMREVARE